MINEIHVLYFWGDGINEDHEVNAFLKIKQACKFLLRDMIAAHGKNEIIEAAKIAVSNNDIDKILQLHKQYFNHECVKYFSINVDDLN